MKIIIKNFNYADEYYEIVDNTNEKYYLEIKNGSIDCKIITNMKKNVGFQYLDINDLIKIYYLELNNKKIIKKIIINEKYELIIDSDDDSDY